MSLKRIGNPKDNWSQVENIGFQTEFRINVNLQFDNKNVLFKHTFSKILKDGLSQT